MKKNILFILAFFATTFQISAQNDIKLTLNHKLGDADFALNQAAKNNLNHDFEVSRLEYYISEISLFHDGGIETLIEDLWILVNASNETEVNLGEYDITELEQIRMHIGVDPDHNHLDPTSYPADHPLAPKAPSMHWGWSAGYRFVAFEGMAGPNYNQLFQLHGLGDSNYVTLTLDLINIQPQNDIINIDLNADYTFLLDDIELNSGLIVHGDHNEAKQCLDNFPRKVFSQKETTSSVGDYSEVNNFNIFPSIIENGIATVQLNSDNPSFNYDILVTSSGGRQIKLIENFNNEESINFNNYASGFYMVSLVKDGKPIITKKLIVK